MLSHEPSGEGMSDITTGRRSVRPEFAAAPPPADLRGSPPPAARNRTFPREPVPRHFHEGAGDGLTGCGHQLGVVRRLFCSSSMAFMKRAVTSRLVQARITASRGVVSRSASNWAMRCSRLVNTSLASRLRLAS